MTATLEDAIEITEGDLAEATFYKNEPEVQRLQHKLMKLKALAATLGYSQNSPVYQENIR